jgi:flagellar biosynthesis/type III secretory pathway protein FliH
MIKGFNIMKYFKKIAVVSITCSLLAISACSNTKKDMIKEGYPKAYAEGFDDGCHSGKQAAGSFFDKFKKDVRRFGSDQQYSQGWSDAFRQCESKQEAIERQTRMAMEMQNYRAQQKHNKWAERKHFNENILKGIDLSGLKNLK